MRMTKLGGLAVLAIVVAVGLFAGIGEAHPSTATPNVLHFTVRINSQHFVDTGKKGNSVGDLVLLADSYRNPGDATVVGHDWETCSVVRLHPLLISCDFAVHIPHGTLTAAGAFNPMRLPWRIPVTGGTGSYAGARGVLDAVGGKHHTERFTFTLS